MGGPAVNGPIPVALTAVKLAHTIVWTFFVACIAGIPLAAWHGEFVVAAWLAAIVFVEVLVLALNRWRCPLTAVAARYTGDRRENFDIYLPLWLAAHNKQVFGSLYLAGVAYAVAMWVQATGQGSG